MASFAPKHPDAQYWSQSIVEIVADAHAIGWLSEVQPLWKAHALMARIFSGRYRGSGRPFINHLAGTAALALRHGGGVTEVLAGFGHAAYEQGEFGRARSGASKANRKEVRDAVGEAAEALIADYDGFNWNEIAKRGNTGEVLVLSGHQKQLLFLHIVNELDDSFDCGVYDAEWCEGCLVRLTAGAEFARAMGNGSLCDQLDARVSYLRSSGLASAKDGRPKRSETIQNPSSKPKYFLKIWRKVMHRLEKMSGGYSPD
jgi:hypothetical protein